MLAYLVMHRGSDVARERLIEAFWPEVDAERARDSLKTTLWAIRRTLRSAQLDPDEFVTSTKAVVRWEGDTALDAQRFSDLVAADDPQSQVEARQLYRGDFLEGDYDEWASAQRERLAEAYERLLGRIVRASKDVATAQSIIDRNPYDEEAYATLIDAEIGAGKPLSARTYYERCVAALREIGSQPSSAFSARFANLLISIPPVSDELDLPFSGREGELSILQRSFVPTDEERKQSAVLVCGEAGIGKSALLRRAQTLAAAAGFHVLAVSGLDEDPRMFGPWPSVYGILTGGDFDAFALGSPSDTASAVAVAIDASLATPTALFIDDCHALRGEALDIFAELVTRAVPKHVVVIGSRPEGVATLRSRLAVLPLTEMPLGPLDRQILEAALWRALGDRDASLFERLYRRSGGHPLFFSGLLRSLVEDGIIVRQGRAWKVVQKLERELELPDSLKSFIETRLRARGDHAQALAGALAIEPLANADDLVAVLGFDETQVFDALDDLLALAIITEPAEGPQFAFRHDLLREVALASVNAGRRTALHRDFARRLEGNVARDASLRRARHLRTSGQVVAAGQSYADSIREAMALNAVQDAIERGDEGIGALENIERTAKRDNSLAELKRLMSQATLAAANPETALAFAHDAVTLARSGGDVLQLACALLDRAAASAAMFSSLEQKADANEAAQIARGLHDDTLLAGALAHVATSARLAGERSDSLSAATEAYEAAVRCGQWTLALEVLAQRLLTQVTWWLFGDALETVQVAVSAERRADSLGRAAFLQARATLWYALERFDESEADLRRAADAASDTAARPDPGAARTVSLPQFRFLNDCMYGAIAAARSRWDQALTITEDIVESTGFSDVARHRDELTLMRIDALLGRGAQSDAHAAARLAQGLSGALSAQSTFGWSDCPALAHARVSARLADPASESRLLHALNLVEENAHSAPLDADRAFSRLAGAAAEASAEKICHRAFARCDYFRALRAGAAGTAWGGQRVSWARPV